MTRILLTLVAASLMTIVLSSCSSERRDNEDEQNESKTDGKSGWITLFDGTSTDGWRGFNSEVVPPNWIIEEGTLKSLGSGGHMGGDIVYGEKKFSNFELELEWKVSAGGNSGIFYHVVEGDKYKSPYENAPEYQLVDNLGFPEPLKNWQMVGADYAMYPADSTKGVVKPANEWNTSKIIFTEKLVEYWLNGEKVVAFVPWSADWAARKNSGKWKDYPDYGKAKSGLIGVQDHGSFIWFRNIRIKEL